MTARRRLLRHDLDGRGLQEDRDRRYFEDGIDDDLTSSSEVRQAPTPKHGGQQQDR